MTTHSTTTAIDVRGLQKSFGDLQVLRDVDLQVARGSIVALLGSNGAGKTTFVKILATLVKGDAGTVRVCGFDVATHAAEVRESFSLTGQFAAVDEILTGRENVILAARLRHLTDAEALADDLLERFSLTDASKRRASTYSGGMRRRLDIAMGLVGDPPVILLDEPTTGLDPQARLEVWQTVEDLVAGGTTVLLTTQYLEEAEQLQAEIRARQEHRMRIAKLAAGDSLALPTEAVAYLAHLRALGLPDPVVDGERDAWILIAAQLPDRMPAMMALKRSQLDTPAVVELYNDIWTAVGWQPGDPRLAALADRIVTLIEAPPDGQQDTETAFELDDDLVALLDQAFRDQVPIAGELLALLGKRGWTCWTRFERIDAAAPGGHRG